MRKASLFLTALTLSYAVVQAADWVSDRADSQCTGWQQRERILTVSNVKELRLLWKRKLENESVGLNSLTPPVILGRIITSRGIKELVLVAGSSDTVHAVD